MKKLLIIIAVLFSSCAHAQVVQVPKKVYYAEIIDGIDQNVVKDIAARILNLTELIEMRQVPLKERTIHMLINSPGGYVAYGSIVLDAMNLAKARGVRFKCFSGVMAMSMAFSIFANCDERYAFENTMLLFHPVHFSGKGIKVQEIMTSKAPLAKMERRMMKFLQKTMGMKWKVFHMNYFSETLWTPVELNQEAPGFVTIVKDIRGLSKIFIHEKPKFRTPLMNTKKGRK